VKPGSFADEFGVGQFQGWVITSINRHPVNNVQDFQTIVSGLHAGDDAVFNVVNPRHPDAGNELLGGTLR
jgi:S1-C subfamily serine protease